MELPGGHRDRRRANVQGGVGGSHCDHPRGFHLLRQRRPRPAGSRESRPAHHPRQDSHSPPEVGDAGDVTDFFVRLSKSDADFRQLLAESTPLAPANTPATETWRSRPQAASDVKRLKDSIQIERVIGGYVELIPSGKVLMGRCCFHDDRVPSLAVFPETQTFHCFGCGKGGDVITFLMELEGFPFREALWVLNQHTHAA